MFKYRMLILALVYSLAFFGMIGRLVNLQIFNGKELRSQGERRLHRLAQLSPIRGEIRDQNGRILAEDKPSYDLWLIPAAQTRVKGKRVTQSLLGENFSVTRILEFADSRDARKEFLKGLLLSDFEESCPLIDRLHELMPEYSKKDLAAKLLFASTGRQADSELSLTESRIFLSDVPLKVFMTIKKCQADPFAENQYSSIDLRIGGKRYYPYGDLMGHITGYVGMMKQEEYEALRGYWKDGEEVPGDGVIMHGNRVFFAFDDLPPAPGTPESIDADDAEIERSLIALRKQQREGKTYYTAGYFSNEIVGRGGVEDVYNQSLRGRHAVRHLQLSRPSPDSPRQLMAVGKKAFARHGETISLTINVDIQKEVRRLLVNAINNTGDSTGNEDPRDNYAIDWDYRVPQDRRTAACVLLDPRNGRVYAMVSVPDYDPGTLNENFEKLLADPRRPLLNKVTQGQYAPGSVMKPIFTLGGLIDGKFSETTEFFCDGVLEFAERRYTCMHHHGHVNAAEALKQSCNIYMYNIGELMGGRKLYHWAWEFGFGHPTGIDIAGESSGHLSNNARTGRGWSRGNTYHMSIGQGPITATPLQVAVAYAALANGGRIVQPHVRHDPLLDLPKGEISLPGKQLETVRKGLWMAINEPHGSGTRAAIRGIEVAGKTGSAEHKKRRPTHAWFACYAPFENPALVCVILVPEGKYGGSTCAPIARRIIMHFFNHIEPDESEWEPAVG